MTTSPPVLRGFCARFVSAVVGLVLYGLDAVLGLQRAGRKIRLKLLLGIAIAAAMILLACSLVTVTRVERTLHTMLSDCLVGIDSVIGMGAAVTDVQANLTALRPVQAGGLPIGIEETFEEAFSAKFDDYGRGIFLPEERRIDEEIKARYADYLSRMKALRNPNSAIDAWNEAFESGTRLRVALRKSMTYNSGRLGELARQATKESDDVYLIFCVLAVAVVLVTGLGVALITFSRLIAEEST